MATKSEKFKQFHKTISDLSGQIAKYAFLVPDSKKKQELLDQLDATIRQFEKSFGKNAQFRIDLIHKSHELTKWNIDAHQFSESKEMRHCIFCGAHEIHGEAHHDVSLELYLPCNNKKMGKGDV